MAREVFRTKTFASDAANFIVGKAWEALGARNEFRIALSGGQTPEIVICLF
jgi:6-phosphogluconolactonase/glucosamine-6-phosphate isomerase/deaminase